MSGSSAKGRDKLVAPTWAEWSRMGWRERQRVRKAGGKIPDPPPMIQLLLDPKQQRQLDRLARQAQVSSAEYAAMVLGRHLDRKAQPRPAARRERNPQERTESHDHR